MTPVRALRSVGRWLLAPVLSLLRQRLWREESKPRFVRLFNVANTIDLKWPISLTVDGADFRVADRRHSLAVARRERLRLYRNGIASRFDQLFSDYLLKQVPMRQGDFVVDVGANIGEVSLLLADRFACRILAIEPEIEEFRCLVQNLRGIGAVCLNSPLWSNEAHVTFFSKNATGDSSLFEISGYNGIRTVKAATLKAVLDRAGVPRVRLLKLEAEGAEPEVLEGASDWLQRIDYVSADVGPERGLEKESTAVPVIARLQEAGFELVDISSPRLVCLFRNKALEPGD